MTEDSELEARLLASLARKAAGRSSFFGNVIARYAEIHEMNDAQLYAYFSCNEFTLDLLRLCKRPDPEPYAFTIDILRVAEDLDLDAGLLANMVREVDARNALDEVGSRANVPFTGTPGLLSAARDHDEAYEQDTDEQEQDDTAERGQESRGNTDDGEQ